MNGGISTMAKRELVATIRDRYRESSKKEKGRILDEFIAVTGNHRKHGIRLLGQSGADSEKSLTGAGRRVYDEAVREAAIVVWEAADRICGKRLRERTQLPVIRLTAQHRSNPYAYPQTSAVSPLTRVSTSTHHYSMRPSTTATSSSVRP